MATLKPKKEGLLIKAHVKQDTCIGCGLCANICSAVYHLETSGKAKADNTKIDALTELGTQQAASNCPVDAIVIS